MYMGKRTERNLAPVEQLIIDLNKDKTLLFIQNVDCVCGYYYHLVENGKTIRRKEGADGELPAFDEGEELLLERECYQEKVIKDGETIYKVWWERGQRLYRI
jgi:hypothetical protein